jgi:hypothetical protein
MKSREEIERLTEDTLNSLDNMQQVEANEFLYGKVINRMQMNERKERLTYRRLVLRLSFTLVLFAGINIASFYVLQHRETRTTKPVSSSANAFAREYSLTGENYNY